MHLMAAIYNVRSNIADLEFYLRQKGKEELQWGVQLFNLLIYLRRSGYLKLVN
jgi:hypothetical protein